MTNITIIEGERMTDTLKIFIENNVDLIEQDVELFIGRAYEQLYYFETTELVEILKNANIDILADIDAFLKKYIVKNIRSFNNEPLDDFIEDIPPFHKTKYELSDMIASIADEQGYDIVYDENDKEWIEERS